MPSWRASDGRGNPPIAPRRRGNSGFRLPGIIKFLLFAGVLAGLVLIVLLTALRPVLRAGVVGWAWDNPGTIMRFPFVSDLVREDLGTALTSPGPGDATESVFTVNPGDTIYTMAPRLAQEGYVSNSRAFLFAALDNGLSDKLAAGTFVLRKNMTPVEVAGSVLLLGGLVVVSVPRRRAAREPGEPVAGSLHGHSRRLRRRVGPHVGGTKLNTRRGFSTSTVRKVASRNRRDGAAARSS